LLNGADGIVQTVSALQDTRSLKVSYEYKQLAE
jgi:hypothetical protein